MRLRREADDQIERAVLDAGERLRHMPRHIDADLVHHRGGERVGSPARTPAESDIDARTGKMLEDRFGHRRAHGVVVAGEEDRARQIARRRPRASALPVQRAEQREQAARGGDIDVDLALEPL